MRKTDRESNAHHADHVVGIDVAAIDRTGDAPPANMAAGQEVVFRGAVVSAGKEAQGHHRHQHCDKDDQVQRRKQLAHRTRGSKQG